MARSTRSRDQATPWGLSHRDEDRERTLTAIPKGRSYEQVARRERVKAALACLLIDDDPADLLDILGIAADEVELARRVRERLAEGR